MPVPADAASSALIRILDLTGKKIDIVVPKYPDSALLTRIVPSCFSCAALRAAARERRKKGGGKRDHQFASGLKAKYIHTAARIIRTISA